MSSRTGSRSRRPGRRRRRDRAGRDGWRSAGSTWSSGGAVRIGGRGRHAAHGGQRPRRYARSGTRPCRTDGCVGPGRPAERSRHTVRRRGTSIARSHRGTSVRSSKGTANAPTGPANHADPCDGDLRDRHHVRGQVAQAQRLDDDHPTLDPTEPIARRSIRDGLTARGTAVARGAIPAQRDALGVGPGNFHDVAAARRLHAGVGLGRRDGRLFRRDLAAGEKGEDGDDGRVDRHDRLGR